MVYWMKDSNRISHGTYLHDPQMPTTVWGWPEGWRGKAWMELGKGGGEVGTSIIASVKKEKNLTKTDFAYH